MKKILIAVSVLTALSALAQTPYVPATRVLREKGYEIDLGADVFQTTARLDKNGNSTDLVGSESFMRYQASAGVLYGLTNNLQIGLNGRFRYNTSTYTNLTGDLVDAESSGLQSIATQLTYAFQPVDRLHYALEGLYRYTPYTNEENGGESTLILGDDGNEYSGGLAVSYNYKNGNTILVRGGYRNPGKDLSTELYYEAQGALVWSGFALIAGVDGVISRKNDPLDVRHAYNQGASALYNSSNRSWVAPYLGLNFALGKQWRVELKGGQVLTGTSTDLGRSFAIQLARRVEDLNLTKIHDTKFKTYDMEASITKVSPKKGYVVIDKGLSDDFQKGLSVDFFEFDYIGGNVLVARGTVISVKAESSIVKITQRFNEKKEIKIGLIARAKLR